MNSDNLRSILRLEFVLPKLLQNSNIIVKVALYGLIQDIYEKSEVPDNYCDSIIIVTIPKKVKANKYEH